MKYILIELPKNCVGKTSSLKTRVEPIKQWLTFFNLTVLTMQRRFRIVLIIMILLFKLLMHANRSINDQMFGIRINIIKFKIKHYNTF